MTDNNTALKKAGSRATLSVKLKCLGPDKLRRGRLLNVFHRRDWSATVYRVLNQFQTGIVTRHNFEGGTRTDPAKHDHLIRQCH